MPSVPNNSLEGKLEEPLTGINFAKSQYNIDHVNRKRQMLCQSRAAPMAEATN